MTDDRREPTFSHSRPVQPPAPRRRPRSAAPVAIALATVALVAAGWWFWWSRSQPASVAPAPAEAVAQPAPAAAPAASEPTLVPAPAQETLKAEDVTAALTQLLGREAVLKFLETTDFPRKFVATLDNLGRDHAPVATWPVRPAPARFLVEASGDAQVIAAENGLRYAPFVAFVGSVSAPQAVALYRRMYPVLEQAWRELGFTNRSLHARVLEVVDLLLATPEPAQPPRLVLTEVKGPVPSTRPWTRYEYADASLQRLASGQKILLRVGADNRKVLKAKLKELRQELLRVSSETARP
jgi:hypothetical protein